MLDATLVQPGLPETILPPLALTSSALRDIERSAVDYGSRVTKHPGVAAPTAAIALAAFNALAERAGHLPLRGPDARGRWRSSPTAPDVLEARARVADTFAPHPLTAPF